MKTIRTALQAKLDAGRTTLTHCARIVRNDGVTLYFTNHVVDLVMNGHIYHHDTGYTPSATTQNAEARSDVVDVEGILTALGVQRSDIIAGLFDGARLYVFITDYEDPVEDDIEVMTGFWGKVRIEKGRFVTEFTSLADRLEQSVGRTIKAACDTEIGSAVCGVKLNPSAWAATTAYTKREARDAMTGSTIKPTTENGYFYICSTAGTSGAAEPVWNTAIGGTTNDGSVVWTTIRANTLTGTVSTVASRNAFTDTSRNEPDDWWLAGKVTWNTGLNAGLSMETKDSTSGGLITLFQAMPYDIQIGDTYTLQVGCRKRHIEDCRDIHDNVINFQGFPYLPTNNQAYSVGGQ